MKVLPFHYLSGVGLGMLIAGLATAILVHLYTHPIMIGMVIAVVGLALILFALWMTKRIIS